MSHTMGSPSVGIPRQVLLDVRWWCVVFDESQLATTKSTGISEQKAYERARSAINTSSMLFLSATPLGDVKDMRAWLKDAKRDLPQYALTSTIGAIAEPLAPCVVQQLATCFFNEDIPPFLARKPELEQTVVEVVMPEPEAAKYKAVLTAGRGIVCGSGETKTMRAVLTKLTSGQVVTVGDVNTGIPRTPKPTHERFVVEYPPTGVPTTFAPAPAAAKCVVGGACCTLHQPAEGLLFQCGHWSCATCGGLSTGFAKNKCPLNCGANNKDVCKAVAATALTSCASKVAAILAEVAKDMERKPTAQFVMMGSSDEANAAVCKALNAAGIFAHKLDSGTISARWADRFKNGELRVLLLNRNQNAGLDLFTADHVYVLSPPETETVRKQIIGRVMRVSTLSANVVQKEFSSIGSGGITTIDEQLRVAAAADADGNAKLPDKTVKRLFYTRAYREDAGAADAAAEPVAPDAEEEEEEGVAWDAPPKAAYVSRPNKRKRRGAEAENAHGVDELTSRFFGGAGGCVIKHPYACVTPRVCVISPHLRPCFSPRSTGSWLATSNDNANDGWDTPAYTSE